MFNESKNIYLKRGALAYNMKLRGEQRGENYFETGESASSQRVHHTMSNPNTQLHYNPQNNLRPIHLYWNRRCKFCNIMLLTHEKSGWCCGPHGSRRNLVPPLPPLLFSFAALQTTASFPNTQDGFIAISTHYREAVPSSQAKSCAVWRPLDYGHQL